MWNNSNIWVAQLQLMQDVHMELYPGLLLEKEHSTGRRLFSPAHWHEI
jgi:hypothetical protein